jgi:hypothetical protein
MLHIYQDEVLALVLSSSLFFFILAKALSLQIGRRAEE